MKKKQQNVDQGVIDLSSIRSDPGSTNDTRYICKEDKQLLEAYPQGQIENPYAGPCYRCPTCNTVYDSSLVKLPRQPRPVNSSIGDARSSSEFLIQTINEDRGLIGDRQDEYDKYNPDPNEDELLKGQGATIIESKIELTDSQGRNRTLVRRSNPVQKVR